MEVQSLNSPFMTTVPFYRYLVCNPKLPTVQEHQHVDWTFWMCASFKPFYFAFAAPFPTWCTLQFSSMTTTQVSDSFWASISIYRFRFFYAFLPGWSNQACDYLLLNIIFPQALDSIQGSLYNWTGQVYTFYFFTNNLLLLFVDRFYLKVWENLPSKSPLWFLYLLSKCSLTSWSVICWAA